MTIKEDPTSTADGVTWDLTDLYRAVDDPQIADDLKSAKDRADKFENTYRGALARLSALELATAIDELQNIMELMDTPVIYGHLLHAAKSDDPERGRLLSSVMEISSAIRSNLVFFELEWASLDETIARALMEDVGLARYKHFLEKERRYRPHQLSEREEMVLERKANTGPRAFSRLFDEISGRLVCDVDHGGEVKRLNESETLALLHDADRSLRRAAADALTVSLKQHQHVLTYIFNVLVQDHKVDDEIRSYSSPMESRNLSNEIEQRTVDALMEACESAHSTVHRYYRLKRRLLDYDELFDYDRYAPLSSDTSERTWDECREVVIDSYNRFSPQAGKIASDFFKHRWIDAELRDGKRGGAFSAGGPASVHPYILCNYTDRIRDVMTVAHELGHGIHQYLSRDVGYLQSSTPLTTAETASVFGEMIVFHRLLEQEDEPEVQLSLLTGKIEDAFATSFRQIVMTRFEQRLHTARREEGELEAMRIGELWLEANAPMHGDTVTLTDNYSHWWSYIPHFIHSPFYTYAYSFGELLVLALYQLYEDAGESFVPGYMEMLSKGGSVSPTDLVAPLGVDINDPGFWDGGLQLLDQMVTHAEELARTVGCKSG
jgi:oligoendopeptidase F